MRYSKRKITGGAAALAVLLTAAAAADVTATAEEAIAATEASQITLLTGDRVLLGAEKQIAGVVPAKGREHIGLIRERARGHTYLIPQDAYALVENGTVDRGLFDVTELARPAYQRLAGGGTPVIVTYDTPRRERPARLLRDAGAPEVRAELASVGGEALTVDARSAAETWDALTTTTRRVDGAPVSTEVTASFTFTSDEGPPDDAAEWFEAVPVPTVTLGADLALDSTAEGGATLDAPVTAAGSAAGDGRLASLSVEVSYDRGETWRELAVEDGAVSVTNPPAGGTVSFRAEVADADGNVTTQTILDAYLTT